MSQSDYGNINPATKSGSQLALDLNAHRDAMQSSHKGSSEPSYKKTGMFWLDDAANPIWILKMYDGTDWITVLTVDVTNNLSSADIDRIATILGPAISVTTGGTANAYTASISPAPTAYSTGMFLWVTWHAKNTGTSNLNLNGLGDKAIKLNTGENVVDNDLPLNGTTLLYYNGTNWVALNVFVPTATRDLDMNNKSVKKAAFTQAANQTASSGTITCNYANGNWFKVTPTGNITLAVSNLPSSLGAAIIVEAVNFGSFIITFPTGIKWQDGALPEFTASGTDLIGIIRDGTGQYWGTIISQNAAAP